MMNTDPLPRVSFYFRFYGDSFDPVSISRRLEVEPTKYFRAGDPKPNRTVPHRRDGWIMEVPEKETVDIRGMISELQALMVVSPKAVRDIVTDLDVEAVCVCAVLQPVDSTTPDLSFPSEFLKWLEELGADLDLDFIITE